MKWIEEKAFPGDILRTRSGDLYHFGICTGENRIVQFGMPPARRNPESPENRVMAVPYEDFSDGPTEKAVFSEEEKTHLFPACEIVKNAEGRLGEGGYSYLHNNCRHFVLECAFGTRNVPFYFGVKRPILNVYFARVPDLTDCEISSEERKNYISGISNAEKRRESLFAWKLLEYGIKDSTGIDAEGISFRENNGKWECDEVCFSISHSHGAVAVAVSERPCGVDVEKISEMEKADAIVERFFTENEKKKYSEEGDFFAVWTAKEAAFKYLGGRGQTLPGVDSTACEASGREVDGFRLSACGDNAAFAHFFRCDLENDKRIVRM